MKKPEPYKKITIQLEVDLDLDSLGKTEEYIFSHYNSYYKYIRYLIETEQLTLDDKHPIVTGVTVKIQQNE